MVVTVEVREVYKYPFEQVVASYLRKVTREPLRPRPSLEGKGHQAPSSPPEAPFSCLNRPVEDGARTERGERRAAGWLAGWPGSAPEPRREKGGVAQRGSALKQQQQDPRILTRPCLPA